MSERRAIALIDGEHYPPTTRWALDVARERGFDVVGCLFVGGKEKIGPGELPDLGVVVEPASGDLAASVRDAIQRHRPDVVLDLSDEPVLGYGERAVVAGVALGAGVEYSTADSTLRPPVDEGPLGVPALAVIGTGKRTGKTAIAGEAARVAAAGGLAPIIVAMGRGGPPEPQVMEAGGPDLEHLRRLVAAGEHAASDYLEDAMFTGVTTIGARRAGGGPAGRPFVTNLPEAARLAEGMDPGLVILEGSGAAVPNVPWDAGVLVCPAEIPEEYLRGYLGPYRILLSDLFVFTMGAGSDDGPQDLSSLVSHVRGLRPDARIALIELRPAPAGDVREKKVYFTTTAPPSAGPSLVASLEERHGCAVVGVSHRLADRAGLVEDLDAAPTYEVLLTELKAAAIDVAAEHALERGAEVVLSDNRAQTVGGDGELPELLLDTARLAVERKR
jgi:cyclic 2,3-diphosphoglycerate synthetase